MKKITFILLLNCLGMLNSSFAFPTVRQVMNFEVGDIFHYQITKDTALNKTVYYIESREVVSKQYNFDSTAISYTFKVISYSGASANGKWCNMKTDSVIETYSSLDSSCTTLYASYIAINALSLDVFTFTFTEEVNSIYNGRTLGKGKKDDFNYVICAEGLGFISHSSNGGLANKRELVWYKKGNETYGTPVAHLIDPYAKILKKGEVFDFAVGDIIQIRVQDKVTFSGIGGSLMSYNKTYMVEQKFLSKAQISSDSIIYTVRRKQQWLANDTIDFYFYQDTITLRLGGLNSYVQDPCKVSVSYGCDSTLSNQVVESPALCCYYISNYIKGVGTFSTNSSQSQYDAYYNSTPTYWFKAAQNKSCGSYFKFDSLYVDSLLRRRDVFDFADGDVFQFERYAKNGNNNSSTYMVEHKILSKTETNNVWTYKIQQKKQPIAGIPAWSYAKIDTIEEVYDKLDDFVAPIANLFTEKYHLCEPLLANEYKNFPQNSHYTNYKIKDVYIKGLGVYHNSVRRPDYDNLLSEKLTYYYKAKANNTCGTPFNFVDFVVPPDSHLLPPTAFTAYYISNEKAIKVQFPESEVSSVVEIMNFEGQKIYQGNVAPKETEINIPVQIAENQLYIVRLLVGGKQSYKKILVAK
jgi:hypothetical protein